SGLVYVIWEEDAGQPLSTWLSDAPKSEVINGQPDILGEEQVLTWMAQSAEVLAQLHTNSIVGCPMTLENLVVQPGDRLVLLDPTGCVQADANDEDQKQAAQAGDIRNLATELERLYVAVRDLNGK